MSLIQKFIATADETRYVCRFCNLSFETERSNCPACGFDEITAD